jgi:AcrR family transcriptional regulator
MANKGKKTRQRIIDKSLQLFSVKGYFHTSINDILEATELTKGGLYCHFKSKEEIWNEVYKDAVTVWKEIVFKDVREISNPVERIEKTVENVLLTYLGSDVFDGGCFFVNMLVELSGQSATMSKQILRGFVGFSRLYQSWLKEADSNGIIKTNLNFREVANFLVISLNGAATLYMSSRDQDILDQSLAQLIFHI